MESNRICEVTCFCGIISKFFPLLPVSVKMIDRKQWCENSRHNEIRILHYSIFLVRCLSERQQTASPKKGGKWALISAATLLWAHTVESWGDPNIQTWKIKIKCRQKIEFRWSKFQFVTSLIPESKIRLCFFQHHWCISNEITPWKEEECNSVVPDEELHCLHWSF